MTQDVVDAVLAYKMIRSDRREIVVWISDVEQGNEPEPGLSDHRPGKKEER